jgi:hypothetical protein
MRFAPRDVLVEATGLAGVDPRLPEGQSGGRGVGSEVGSIRSKKPPKAPSEGLRKPAKSINFAHL